MIEWLNIDIEADRVAARDFLDGLSGELRVHVDVDSVEGQALGRVGAQGTACVESAVGAHTMHGVVAHDVLHV